MNDSNAVLADLAGILRSFQGREYFGDITRETLFFSDLGFASIDAVVLGERSEGFYDRRIPFNRFMAESVQRNARDIRVGELADFLAAQRDSLPIRGNSRMSMQPVDGVTLHYQQQGSGPDVVLVHAFTSNLSIWSLSGIVEELASEYRVTTYDLRGHGLSSVTPNGYESAQMAADLRQLHSALGLERAHLVGHSFGGVIAAHAALDFPEVVASVVFSDSYFPGLRHLEPDVEHTDIWTDLRERLLHVGTDIGDHVDFGRLFRAVAGWSHREFDAVERELGAVGRRWLTPLAQLANTTAGEEMFAESGLTAQRIRQVQQPVTALYDEFSPFEATCDWLQRHLTICRTAIVPMARHLAPVQNPTAFIALVRDHLRRVAD